MSDAIVVRRITSNDGAILRALRISALSDAPFAFGARLQDVLADPEEKFDRDAARHGDSDSSTTFLAFEGEEPVGMMGAFFENSTSRPFICAFWVSPDHRGGAASKGLLGSGIGWLAERGANEVYAWVADSNIRARAFYKRNGFIELDECQPLPSDPSRKEHLYRHSLPC